MRPRRRIVLDIDGARLFNAATALNCQLKDLTTGVGLDILSLGGTKVNRRIRNEDKSIRSDRFDVRRSGGGFQSVVDEFRPDRRSSEVSTQTDDAIGLETTFHRGPILNFDEKRTLETLERTFQRHGSADENPSRIAPMFVVDSFHPSGRNERDLHGNSG